VILLQVDNAHRRFLGSNGVRNSGAQSVRVRTGNPLPHRIHLFALELVHQRIDALAIRNRGFVFVEGRRWDNPSLRFRKHLLPHLVAPSLRLTGGEAISVVRS